MGIRVKSTCDEMRGSVRAGSERRNARVKQAAGLLKPWKETLKHPALIGRPLRIRRRLSSRGSSLTCTCSPTLLGQTMQQLEADNAVLAVKVERQQRQPHEGFVVNSDLEPIIVGTPFNDPMVAAVAPSHDAVRCSPLGASSVLTSSSG
jgi:hypothetical protein